MSRKEFEELLRKHESKPAEKGIDWQKQKTDWLAFIKTFYAQVEAWFAPFQQEGKLSYQYKKIEITEDYVGTYDVDVMVVDFAGQRLTLEPSGTLLIGTKGKIVMEGARGSVQFILADKNSTGIKITESVSISGKQKTESKEPDWTWKIVLREPRRISYAEFTEENFFDALMEVVNG